MAMMKISASFPHGMHAPALIQMYHWDGMNNVWRILIQSFILDISIVPLQVHYYSEAFPTTALITVSELTRWNATSNCERRTCPRSLCGG